MASCFLDTDDTECFEIVQKNMISLLHNYFGLDFRNPHSFIESGSMRCLSTKEARKLPQDIRIGNMILPKSIIFRQQQSYRLYVLQHPRIGNFAINSELLGRIVTMQHNPYERFMVKYIARTSLVTIFWLPHQCSNGKKHIRYLNNLPPEIYIVSVPAPNVSRSRRGNHIDSLDWYENFNKEYTQNFTSDVFYTALWEDITILRFRTYDEIAQEAYEPHIGFGVFMDKDLFNDHLVCYAKGLACAVQLKFKKLQRVYLSVPPRVEEMLKRVLEKVRNNVEIKFITGDIILPALVSAQKGLLVAVLNAANASAYPGQAWATHGKAQEEMLAVGSSLVLNQHPSLNQFVKSNDAIMFDNRLQCKSIPITIPSIEARSNPTPTVDRNDWSVTIPTCRCIVENNLDGLLN